MTYMASWKAWETMASSIQLSLAALENSNLYNPFSSRFPFPVVFHRCNVYRFDGVHTTLPLLPPDNHARVQELAFISM